MTNGQSETAVILNGNTGLPGGTTTSLPPWMNSLVQAVGETNGQPTMPASMMPTATQRGSIVSRIEALERELVAADPRDIAQVVAGLFMSAPSQSLSVDAQKAKIALFVEALDGLPLWALKAASLKWRRGEVPGNAAFAPSAGELRRVVDAQMIPHRAAIVKLRRVLTAKAMSVVEHTPESRQRMAAKFSDLARSISDNARREAP